MDAMFEAMLGYLNYSDGSASVAFERNLNDFYHQALADHQTAPWEQLRAALSETLQSGAHGFKEVDQARAVVELVFGRVMPAYREHHRDLLFHLSDADLWQPLFLARIFEATLAQQGPWSESERIVQGAVTSLSDYLGFRPVATLETEQKIEPYAHERVGLIPVYLRDVGVAVGRYQPLLARTLEVLSTARPDLLEQASLELANLEEIALDPRAYDFGHPANQRPGYQFGEWDRTHLNRQGRYCRFVLRPMILDVLRDWIDSNHAIAPEEALYEASAALAGTMLLAAGISGGGPHDHDSRTTLGTLVPRIARCRDLFYSELVQRSTGALGERLRREANDARQPFGGVRQSLNLLTARRRAAQLQHRRLATVYSTMGHGEASRREASVIPATSIRLGVDLQNILTEGDRLASRCQTRAAAEYLVRAEDLLHRAVECGAMVDPWNILGFAGNFSLFPALENSIVDPRVDQLLSMVEQIFKLYARVLRESAAIGDEETGGKADERLGQFADWWDKHATIDVSDVRRVSGRELAQSARFVAKVLTDWRQSGEAAGNVAFWRRHAAQFTSPHIYAVVVDALLQKKDSVSAMALMMSWLGQVEQVPLQDGDVSFHSLAIRWMAGVLVDIPDSDDGSVSDEAARGLALVRKFFDYLEVNAEEYWQAPRLDSGDGAKPTRSGLQDAELAGGEADPDGDEEDLFAAAYEGITFRDSAADGREGETIEGGPGAAEEALDNLAERLRDRLAFLTMLARLWQLAAGAPWSRDADQTDSPPQSWAKQALRNRANLLHLLESLGRYRVAPPTGSQDSILDFDRQQAVKTDLLQKTIETCIETSHAVCALLGASDGDASAPGLDDWERSVIGMRRSLWNANAAEARDQLPALLTSLRQVSLLYVPLEQGGQPQRVYNARYARDSLRKLAIELPSSGLFRETHRLLEAAMDMEKTESGDGMQVTEFNVLFQVAYKSALDNLIDFLATWPETREDDEQMTAIVGVIVGRFSRLWIEHSSSVALSELERRVSPSEWEATVRFIKTYGGELFTQRFMTFGNLRGILGQGIGAFLDSLAKDQDPLRPMRLVADLGVTLAREEAIEQLQFILRAVLERWEAYSDYNATTSHSDYGQNLFMLLELLRVQVGYERRRWALQPAYIAHGALCRKGRAQAALLLERAFIEETQGIANHFIEKLHEIETKYGLHVATISDRLDERLVKPLHLDRLLALVEPAVAELRDGDAGPVFARFQRELEKFSQTVTGVGLDAPRWIRQLEIEVDRCIDLPAEESLKMGLGLGRRAVPHLSFAEFKEQLDHW